MRILQIKIKEKMYNNNGGISILFVILCLIAVFIIAGLLNFNKVSYIQNELQSAVDISSTNALKNALNLKALKEKEEISTDGQTSGIGDINSGEINVVDDEIKKQIKLELNQELSKNLALTDMGIVNYWVENVEISEMSSEWGVNYSNGIAHKKYRPMLYVDAIIQVQIKSNVNFDVLSSYNLDYYSAKDNQNKNVAVSGIEKDGITTLAVRTASRVVYR